MIISNSKNYVPVKTRKICGRPVKRKCCDSLKEVIQVPGARIGLPDPRPHAVRGTWFSEWGM